MASYEVAEYMVARLDGQHHPALLARPGSGIIFDGVRKRWVLEADGTDCGIPYDEIYRATFEARDRLLATANKYRKKVKEPLLDLNFNHDWREVEESVQDACSGLEQLATKDKDMSGSLGKPKNAFRGLCRNAGVGQTAATLIPNDSFGFTSVLCGSLKVVFTGLRTTGVYRQEVYKTLEDLPSRLKDLAADVKTYDRDAEVHRRAAALYVASFNLLSHILHWFLKNRGVTGIKLLADPTGFTEKLREQQAELKMASQSFEAYLNKLARETGRESIQLQYWSTYQQAGIQDQLQTIERRLIEERTSRVEVLEQLKPLLNNMMSALQEKATAELNHRAPKFIPDIDPEHILSHFLYEPELIHNDCAALTKRENHLRAQHDVDRITALRSNSRLRAWLTMDESSMLLVNGRADPRPDSEVSLVVAKMLEHLLKHHQRHGDHSGSGAVIIPLGFFCGQHRDWRVDHNGSPEEAAMSLLLQLIARVSERLDPAVLRQCYEHMRPEDIGSICSTLATLTNSLDSQVVLVVVVDGLRFFAQPSGRRYGTRELVSCLTRLYREKTAATIKLLFASPTRSEFVEDLFTEEEILDIPRHLSNSYKNSPGRSRKAVSARAPKMEAQVDRPA